MLSRQPVILAVLISLVGLRPGITVAAPEKQEAPACSQDVPSMSGLQLTPPPDGLDPGLATFLGAWEGQWETPNFPPLPSRLVVYRIDASTSTAFYAWGSDGASMRPDSSTMNLQVDGKTLRLGTDIRFSFTLNGDGTAIEGVRETSRGLVSKITMTRCTLAGLTEAAAGAQQPAAGLPGAVSPEMVDQQMAAYASEVLLEGVRLWMGQQPRREMQINEKRTNILLVYKGPGDEEFSTIYSVDPEGKPRFVAAIVRAANVHNARNYITADAIYGTLAKYFLAFPEPFHAAIWKQYRQPSGAPTIERAWDNEDGSVEAVGAALWGQNAANGPGNYMAFRARLFPGSPHHAERTLFTS